MKIDLNEYTPIFEEILGLKQTSKLLDFLNKNLPCTKCKKFKTDAEFADAKQLTNRRGKYSICRKCDKLCYMKKKLKDFQ